MFQSLYEHQTSFLNRQMSYIYNIGGFYLDTWIKIIVLHLYYNWIVSDFFGYLMLHQDYKEYIYNVSTEAV